MAWLLTTTLSVSALLIIPHIYLGWRFKKYVAVLATPLRWIPAILLVSFYLSPVIGILQWLAGSPTPILSGSLYLTYWFWFGLVCTFQLLTAVILFDVVKAIITYITNWPLPRLKPIFSYALVAISTVLMVYTAAKMWVDTEQIITDHLTLHREKLPDSFNNFRIVHITDLQADAYTDRKEIATYIQKVNQLNPDLVVFTGDLISWGTDYIDMAAEELSKVEATYGLYSVVGDHDYWAGIKPLKKAYQKYEIPLLQDENIQIAIKNDTLLLSGITEVYSDQIKIDSLKNIASRAQNIRFRIMAAHQATQKLIDAAKKYHYQLLLGGHTHGGQIRVPFMFTHISAPSFETEYISGPYHLDNLLLNINNGLGFTLAPVRYAAPPSISVIDVDAR